MTAAVGCFDGVHRGHRAILEGAEVAVTFRTHPLATLAPEKAPWMIMSVEQRLAAIHRCGVREVRLVDFDATTAAMSPEDFVIKHLHGVSCVRCGEDWRFGRRGIGDARWLRDRGIETTVVAYAELDGKRVSSSRIRAAISPFAIAAATAMLGHTLEMEGTVKRGKGEGRKLGFPTVNLFGEGEGRSLWTELKRGVYAVEAGGRRALANFGMAPTFRDRSWQTPVLEVHFLDDCETPAFEEGRLLVVTLERFIRDERRFESVEALKRQIAADKARCMI